MKTDVLKQSELFVLLAMILLIFTVPFRNNYPKIPPVITLSEEDESFRFESGSDEISPEYGAKLLFEIFPKIDSISRQYDCNAIQVIGHTSGFPVRNTDSTNLDELLTSSIYNYTEPLKANSNADLGLMRAVSVIRYLRLYKYYGAPFYYKIMKNREEEYSTFRDTLNKMLDLERLLPQSDTFPDLGKIEYFFPLSAGPLIQENGYLIDSVKVEKDLESNSRSRRRIEIRLFRYENSD